MRRRTTKLLVLALLLACTTSAQPVDSTVHAALVRELEAKSVPGGVVVVVDGDRITCLTAAGLANTSTGQAVTTEMLFRLGSTTKMFVATAALLMAHEGRICLDTSIHAYLPTLPERLGRVTLRQLLTHTAGISDEAPMVGPPDDGALAREIDSWTDERAFLDPGVAFSYSNPGYWLVGRVLEVADGKAFADVIETRVLRPLGMMRSTFRPEVAARYPLAAGHDRDEDVIDPPPNHAGTWPSGSLFSSGPELARFAMAVLHEGMLEGRRVLPAAVVQQLLRPMVGIRGVPGSSYGYGLVFRTYRNEPVAYHSGARLGYGSIIDLAPQRNVAVIALGNRTGSLLSSSIYAGFSSRFTMGEEPPATVHQGSYLTDPEAMSPFVGRYVNRAPIEVEIYNRSALPLVRVGEILTFKRGYERIPLQIVDDSTASIGHQTMYLTRAPSGQVQLLHFEMHTLRRAGGN